MEIKSKRTSQLWVPPFLSYKLWKQQIQTASHKLKILFLLSIIPSSTFKVRSLTYYHLHLYTYVCNDYDLLHK